MFTIVSRPRSSGGVDGFVLVGWFRERHEQGTVHRFGSVHDSNIRVFRLEFEFPVVFVPSRLSTKSRG